MFSSKIRVLKSTHALFAIVLLVCGSIAMSGANCITLPGFGIPTTGNAGVTGKFVGSARCSQCHANQHTDWLETLHAEAYETLESIGQNTNNICLPCHVVGFGEDGGFVDVATTFDLRGVGCESCHGSGRDHVENVADESLRPTVSLAASICGECHTGSRHPHIDEWMTSGHALVTETPAEDFEMGILLNNCGQCHSGDFFYRAILEGETVPDDAIAGVPREDQIAITCAICHDPHGQTGNAAPQPDGRDFQLRFKEATSPTPTNTIDATTNAARFNLCGQCHHSRGRTWQSTSREPHASNQVNVFVGEMPIPEGLALLVASRVSVHSFAVEQCATCHMFRQDFMDEEAPAISGHTFGVNNAGCAGTGCHPSTDAAVAAQATLQTEIQGLLDDIKTRLDAGLGGAAGWEYTSNGGPDTDGQNMIADEIKQVRFLYYYVLSDGSLGVHNPAYVRSMLEQAQDLLTGEGL